MPHHERALRAALAPHFALVSISSDVNAEQREYERTATTVLNASVMPLATRYLDELRVDLAARHADMPVHLLHSAGGMMSMDMARARPLLMAMSGPAAGVAASAWLARSLRLDRALAFDMGGTTTDVCLIVDGVAETAAQRRLGDVPVRLPAVAVESIGAGGGSVAFVDGAGALKVGPRSAGAQPGPASYGQGGTEPTVTDANLVLGYLNPERIYGGSIQLDRGRAEAAFAPLCRALGLSLIDAAHGVVEVANASMLRALRLVSVQRGHDLREFALIAYGGAGPIHAGALARLAAMRTGGRPRPLRRVLGARLPGVPAALRRRADSSRPPGGLGRQASRRPLRRSRGALPGPVPRGRHRAGRGGGRTGASTCATSARTMSWRSPTTATRAACAPPSSASTASSTATPPGRAWRASTCAWWPASRVRPPRCPPSRATTARSRRLGEGRAHFPATSEIRLPRYDRQRLPVGHVITGPALVEDDSSTVLVYPGQGCRADRFGNLLIEEQR